MLWRPLLYVWFGLLHALFGLHPLPYHVATEAAILVEAYLAYRLARRHGLGLGALVAGAVVYLHASTATPVLWTSAASSPLAASFALGAMLSLGASIGDAVAWWWPPSFLAARCSLVRSSW